MSGSCILTEMAHRVSLATGTATIRGQIARVLGLLREPSNFWLLAEYSDLPLSVLSAILKEFQSENLADLRDREWVLTEAGTRLADREGVYPYRDHPCPACRGKAMNLVAYRDLLERFESASRGRPEPLKDLDQGYVTGETVVARVALMETRGDLVGKSIFILGDDDLLSVAIGLHGGARRVVAAEADERIVDFIAGLSERLHLKVEAALYNAMDPLPSDWVEQFDVFETDPVEAETGFRLFLKRCFVSLKRGGGAGYFGLTHREASLFKWRRLQAFLLESGFVIGEMIHDFNEYVPWGYHEQTPAFRLGGSPGFGNVWYKSTQFRVERVEDVALTNEKYEGLAREIYDDAEQTTK